MSLAAQAAALLGEEFLSTRPLHGGDLAEVLEITFATGRTLVAKSGPAPEAEAEMLRAISATGCAAPRVVGANGAVLLLEKLEDGGALSPAAWADLGENLRLLHAATGETYGWHADYAFGRVPILNQRRGSWCDFWAEMRLAPALPHVAPDLARRIEALITRLPEHLPDEPAPSLLHGDLWSGNLLAAANRITGLIDPASYYGHAEVDLAMLALFGRPGPAFIESYGTPQADWPERCAIYQLWPALVHLRLFGAGYGPMVDGLLSRLGL